MNSTEICSMLICVMSAGCLLMLLMLGAKFKKIVIPFGVLFLIGVSGFYLSKTDKENMIAIKKITSENDILNITKFEFSAKLAHQFDKNATNNATCSERKCVYSGYVSQNGDMLYFSLLSNPKVSFECKVENQCKVNSYIEHGERYLRVISN